MAGSLVLKREPPTPPRIIVVEAPDEILISVELLRDFDPAAMHFYDADKFWIGDENTVTYQISGWDKHAKALLAERIA